MIVAVEGLDGCGKTTVSRILAKMIGGTCVAVPPPKLALLSTALFEDVDSDARYLHYLSGVVAVAEMHRGGGVLVADRFVASAHALHLGSSTVLARSLRRLPLPVADVTFYLDVDEDIRGMRLRDRCISLDPFETLLAADAVFRERVAEQMRAYPHTHIIDTTDCSPKHVAEIARKILESLDLPIR